MDWVVNLSERVFPERAVMADSLDAQEASVGGEADLPQCRQVRQPFADVEVAGVVDDSFGAKRPPFLVILLDLGLLVLNAQGRGDVLGDDRLGERTGLAELTDPDPPAPSQLRAAARVYATALDTHPRRRPRRLTSRDPAGPI